MKTLDDTVRETIRGILDGGLDVPLLKSMWNASKKGSGEISKNLSNVVVETMRNYHALWVYDGRGSINPALYRASFALTGSIRLAIEIKQSLPLIMSKELAMEAANEYTVSRSAISGVVKTGLAEYIKFGVKEVVDGIKEAVWD